MERDPNSLLAELHGLVSAIESSAREGDASGLKIRRKVLDAWVRQLLLHQPSTGGAEGEAAELRQKLRASKASFDSMITAYKAVLEAFETFRGSIDLVQQIKRLEDLPETLAAIRRLRSLHTLNLTLDRELFAGRIPEGVGQAGPEAIRERLRQFSPSPHAPRLFLGEVRHVEDPEFFLGLDARPEGGSCFIFALGHKYQRGKTIGVVAAYDPDPVRYAPDKATDFLSHFCDILGCTLITALEHAQLEELTVRDALTGVNNRAYLERHAGRILDFARRKKLPVHLLFIDLNGFKAVNDSLGHEAGDSVLVAVARAIQAMVRKYDIFVRLGGDEFVILLPDTDERMAGAFVERLRRTLDGVDVGRICGLDTDLRVSASVGMSQLRPGQDLDELIRAADRRMYEDKAMAKAAPAARNRPGANPNRTGRTTP